MVFPYFCYACGWFWNFLIILFTGSLLTGSSDINLLLIFKFSTKVSKNFFVFFFYLSFLSWTFTNQRTAGKGGGHSLIDPPHRRLDISRAITAENSPLHIASSRHQTGNLWFPGASLYPLSYLNISAASLSSETAFSSFTVFQNCLLSVIFLTFRLLN